MSGHGWSVIFFPIENSYETCPSNWIIDDNNCYFPPDSFLTPTEFRKLVRKRSNPEDGWNVYSASVLGSYDSLKKAEKKTRSAKKGNNLTSSNNECTIINRKRTVKRNLKYVNNTDTDRSLSSSCSSSSRESSSNSSDDEDTSQVKKKKAQPPSKNTTMGPNLDDKSSSTSIDMCRKNLNEHSQIDLNTPSHSRGNISSRNKVDTLSTYTIRKTLGTNAKNSSQSSTPPSSSRATTPVRQGFAPFEPGVSLSSSENFQKEVMRQFHLIRIELQQHSENFAYLLRKRTTENSEVATSDESKQDFVEIQQLLPITTFENLEHLEIFLSSEEKKDYFAQQMSVIGGSTTKEIVRNILFKTLSSQIGMQYNWLGKKQKKAFSKLNLSKAIIMAVRKNRKTDTATEAEIIYSIKQWLVRAKERVELEAKPN